jgi:hypothetical protein
MIDKMDLVPLEIDELAEVVGYHLSSNMDLTDGQVLILYHALQKLNADRQARLEQ